MQFWTGFLDSIGPGIIAGLMIVTWDLARIYVQSRWLVRRLNQESESENQRYQVMADQVKLIAEKLGVENDSEHSSTDQA